MLWSAPLQVTVEIVPVSGQPRVFRLSERIELPPRIHFRSPLPVEEPELLGRLRFQLPDGPAIEALATLRQDPDPGQPGRGLEAELQALRPEEVAAIQRYIEERNLP
jgi:hypothetical protein